MAGASVWSHDGMYVNFNAFKEKVKITFFHRAQLPDPDCEFSDGHGGNEWRSIDIQGEAR